MWVGCRQEQLRGRRTAGAVDAAGLSTDALAMLLAGWLRLSSPAAAVCCVEPAQPQTFAAPDSPASISVC